MTIGETLPNKDGKLCCGACGDALSAPAETFGAVSRCRCGESSVVRDNPDDIMRPSVRVALRGTAAAVALIRDAQRNVALDQLDEQSRERLIRAAEDSVRGELRRVNAALCEAVAENERLSRIETCKATCCYENERRAVRAEAALTDALLKLNAAEHARDAYRIRAQAAERTVGMPATGRCVQCAAQEPMIQTSDGDLCGACWAQRGAAAE